MSDEKATHRPTKGKHPRVTATLDAKCINCKFFERTAYPVMSWEKRKAAMLEKYRATLNSEWVGMSEAEAETLASNAALFESGLSHWGKCKYKQMPELRDVELDGRKFGCIYFKKR